MASSSFDEEAQAKEEATTAEGEEQENVKHRFSEPWEDSDLILIVEDEKFHVHRLILSMNSPVFKAMFKSGFQEANNNEIQLPGKRGREVLDFLKQFYIQEKEEITVENVEHLARLSDEYQVKSIFERCVQFLKKQSIKKGNVLKILRLANLYELKDIRQNCYELLKNMRLQPILEIIQRHDDVDKEGVQNILIQRIQRLESFLDSLYPQFIGMVECCFWLWHEGKKYMEWCPRHFHGGRSSKEINKRLQECSVCKEMLNKFIEESFDYDCYRDCRRYKYGAYNGYLHFDEDLPDLILEYSEMALGQSG